MLTVQNISKSYYAKEAMKIRDLTDVSISFPDKGMVFLLGEPEGGQSILVSLLGGLCSPGGGDILVDGRRLVDFTSLELDEYRNKYVGFIFQGPSLINELNVHDNLLLALKLQGEEDDEKLLADSLQKVGLPDCLMEKADKLSLGQKQRVAIARLLVKGSKVILADEPTASIDQDDKKKVLELLKDLSGERLVVVASCDRELAKEYGDRVIELKDGKILRDSGEGFKGESGAIAPISHEEDSAKASFPLSYASKIAASAFKKKNRKSFSAIALASIAFSLLASSFSFATVDRNSRIAEGLEKSHLQSVKVVKRSYDVEGKEVASDTYGENIYEISKTKPYFSNHLFNEDDLEYLNSRGADAAGVFEVPHVGMESHVGLYNDNYYSFGAFDTFSDCGKDYCDKHFTLEAGRYPENIYEMAISSYKADALLNAAKWRGNKLYNSRDEIVGSSLSFDDSAWGGDSPIKSLTISGIYKTCDIPEKFSSLKKSSDSWAESLYWDYLSFKESTFLDVAFVTPDFFDAYVGRRDYEDGISRAFITEKTTVLGGYTIDDEPLHDAYSVKRAIPSKFMGEYSDQFQIYGLDGKRVESIDLKDGEVLVSKEYRDRVIKDHPAASSNEFDLFDESSGERYKALGYISSGPDDLRGAIVANPNTLRKMGVRIYSKYTVPFHQTKYGNYHNGKYSYVLASSINGAKAVSTLNRDFGEYRFLSIDPVSLIVDETLNSVVVVNIIFAVVGVVFLVLSALLFSSFVKDSINDKEKEINTLRAMGASAKKACKIFVLEASFFALLTTLIGSLFGWVLLICANWCFNVNSASAGMALYHYGVLNVIIILALAVSASLLASFFHIKPIANKKIIDAVNAD